MKRKQQPSIPALLGAKTIPPVPPPRVFKSAEAGGRALKTEWGKVARAILVPSCEQARTGHRCVEVLTGLMFSLASGTLTDSIRARAKEQEDWSADYRLFSWNRFSPNAAFRLITQATVPWLGNEGPIYLAVDDTNLPKTGKKMARARFGHNPLAPPWQPEALMWAHPMFHAGLIVLDPVTLRPTLITVAFETIMGQGPKQKKRRRKKRGRPSKKELARREQAKRLARKKRPAATDVAVLAIQRIRGWLDECGQQDRLLIVVGDNSYTNRTVFSDLPDRTVYVGRTRPDARLQLPGRQKKDGTFMYGADAQSPAGQAVAPSVPGHWGTFIYGGAYRKYCYKHVGPVFRRTSTQKLPLRLLALKPVKFRVGKRTGKSQRAFLLTTDFTVPVETLIQAYLLRWSIEVAHRDMKTGAKVGKAHVHTDDSVKNLHAAMAAACSILWICILRLNGGMVRTAMFVPLEKWKENHIRWRQQKRKAEGRPAPVLRATFEDALRLFRVAHVERVYQGLLRIA